MSNTRFILESVKEIAAKAGEVIMEVYRRDFEVAFKDDQSPLTAADTAANRVICSALKKLTPAIPVLSEENKEIKYSQRSDWQKLWLVDPVDGTKEFIKKNDEFTVNIALIENGIPVLGVVYAPALNDMYFGEKSTGSFKNKQKLPTKTNESPESKLTVIASRSHLSPETADFINKLKENTKELETISRGSSLKLCLVAEGEADYYPRLAPTMEWDTAAAHAICLAAGKKVIKYDSDEELVYNKESLLNPWFVVH